MFTQEGTVKLKITEVTFADAKFAPGDDAAFDICLKCEGIGDNEGKYDWWRGEMSNNFGKGTVSHMTQAQLTFRTLRKLGFEGDDLTALHQQIIGTETEGYIKASAPNAEGKVFYNLRYLGPSDSTPSAIEDVSTRFKKLMAAAPAPVDAAAQPDAAPKTATAKTAPAGKARNPFG
jgi:hypothetical protein